MIDGEEVARAGARAGATASRPRAYLFYDCQTDDARLVLTVLGEAERFGAVIANRCEVAELARGATAGGRGRALHRRRSGRVRGPRRQRGQRHRRLGRPHPPRGALRRGGGAAHPPEPRHPRHALERAPAARRGRDRARGRRAHDLRAAVAGAHADRHDRQRLRGRRSTTSRPTGATSTTCSTPATTSSDRRSAPPTSPAPTRACGR